MEEQDKNTDDGLDKPVRKIIPWYALHLRHMLRPKCVLWVSCWRCKRREALDIIGLIEKFGAELGMNELKKKNFKCRDCGNTWTQFEVEWLEDAKYNSP